MNAFKQKLRACETVSLINPDHVSPGLVHFVAGLGIDAVMLDCEQGAPGFEDVENMARAARLHGVAALVRIPSPEPWTIERYMMRGIDGIVVPRLDTAAQVRKAVHDIRYAAAKDFERLAIVVQIESVSAVADIDGFLAVPEVDCYFIGAVDLAKSMGFAGNYAQPEVMAVLCRTVARIREAGRSAGFLVSERDTHFWQSKGANMLYTHVNDFLRIGARHWRELSGAQTLTS